MRKDAGERFLELPARNVVTRTGRFDDRDRGMSAARPLNRRRLPEDLLDDLDPNLAKEALGGFVPLYSVVR